MLNSKVPFVCSLAIAMALPSAASSGLPASGETKVMVVGNSLTTQKTVSFALPGQDEMPYVHAYIQENDESLLAVKQRSKRYFTMIESVLRKFGLPPELKYLAVIESDLKTTAVSRVGAKGPWQLMASTAQDLGLKVDSVQDERTNFYKSTKAAALYLRDLHRTFKDWRLVLAAYNAGPLPVYRAMHRSGSTDFRVLERYLPRESRQHVKRFMATAYYFDGLESQNESSAPVSQNEFAVRVNPSAPSLRWL
jgi:soluble lytic murein transglycosylase-like protein